MVLRKWKNCNQEECECNQVASRFSCLVILIWRLADWNFPLYVNRVQPQLYRVTPVGVSQKSRSSSISPSLTLIRYMKRRILTNIGVADVDEATVSAMVREAQGHLEEDLARKFQRGFWILVINEWNLDNGISIMESRFHFEPLVVNLINDRSEVFRGWSAKTQQ